MDPQQGPSQADLLIGQTIGNYLVTQKLGEGGMGSVYLAEHPSIGKKVALKVLHSEFSTNQEVAARFFTEAKAVNDIGHPNIVDIVDFGILQAGGGREQLVYFIMEYLAGVTLSHLIRAEAPLPPERALAIALQVADALSASHRCGIVHRDLKPDNIILLHRGRERDFVKLLDFGIAKLTGGSAMGSHRTRTGIVMGTPAYMSPEQCEGRDSVDLRTDVYALGIVLYEMLTGRVPFLGEGYGEILVQHLTQRPTPPSQFRMLSPHVEAVVMKALEKRAEMRYPTMDEFMRAMSDPVGYVESHGSLAGFLQRQLTPSSAPVTTSIRLPPSTPVPGSMSMPSTLGGVTGSTGMGTGAGFQTPTTLGSAAGQQQTGGRSSMRYIIAGVVTLAAAAIAIAIVATGKNVDPGGGSAAASGSAVISAGSDGSGTAGSATVAAGGDHGSAGTGGSVTAGSDAGAVAMGGSDAGAPPTIPPDAAAGSAGATPGSNTGPEPGPHSGSAALESVAIDVKSTPPGARILVDGVDTGKITPDTLNVPRRPGKKLSVSLKMKGYNVYTFKSVDLGGPDVLETDLVKTRTGSTPPNTGNPGRNPGSARPPTQGSGDPDGLMHP